MLFKNIGRKILSTLLAGSLLATSTAFSAAAASTQTPIEANATFADTFQNAVELDSTVWTRWWLLNGGIFTEETISRDLKSMADAGLQNVEVNNQNFFWTDVSGGTNYMDVFYWILKYAEEYGLTIDWSTGDMYPAAIPTSSEYYDKSIGTYALKYETLEVGEGLVNEDILTISSSGGGGWPGGPGGGGGPMPMSLDDESSPLDGYEKLIAVTAAYLDENDNALATVSLVDTADFTPDSETHSTAFPFGKSSNIILTDIDDAELGYDGDYENGLISMTEEDLTALLSEEEQSAIAGKEGGWTIFTFYKAENYVNNIDYFSSTATVAWANYWENSILGSDYWSEAYGISSDELTALFEKVSGNLFEDSLERTTMNYTDGIFDAFEEVNGYEFPMDKLCTMIVGKNIACTVDLKADSDYMVDSVADRQLRNDYYDTLTELYNVNHMGVYTEWAKSHGLGTKMQASYNYTLDQDSVMDYITIAENETLNANDRLDVYRSWVGSANAHGINIISSESGANSDGKSYTCTWSDWLWHFNMQYAGGVNQSVLHGVDYLHCGWGTVWPGKSGAGATAGQCESMGQRMPYFELLDDTISAYLAREQMILQEGTTNSDVAFYYYAYDYGLAGDSGREYFGNDCLEKAGYNYQFIGDSSISHASYDAGQDVIFPDGPSYSALILNQNRVTDDGTLTGMIPVATAEKILELAKQGLKVVVVGGAPDKSANQRDHYVDGVLQDSVYDAETGETIGYGDAQVRTIMKELLALDNVVEVAEEADIADTLAGIDVLPANAFCGDSSDLYSFHRSDDNVDYYFLFNSSYTSTAAGVDRQISTANPAHDVSLDVEFDGEGVPYLLNCWTGEVTRISEYTLTESGKYRIHVEIPANETMMIAIGTEEWYTDGLDDVSVVADTDAPQTGYTENGQLYAAASEIGDYTVTTADGSTKVASVESVPQTLTPSDWSLTLKLYQANEDFQNGIKGDKNANVYDIVKVQTGAYDPVDSETGELLPWIEISDDLTGASGVGTYTATITVPEDFDAETDGYVLNFDEVTEVYTVSLNGVQLPGANQNIPSVDVSGYLKPGINTLEVQVASGLFNAVKFYNTADSAAGLDAFSRDSTYKDWWSPDGIIGSVSLTGYTKVEVGGTVYSMNAPENVTVNEDFTVELVTDAVTSGVRLYNENDMQLSVKNTEVTVLEDGRKLWKLTLSMGTIGDGRIIKAVIKGSASYYYYDGNFVTVNVKSVAPVLAGFELPETAVVNRTFVVKAVTGMDATKIAVYNEYGMKMGIRSLSYQVVDGQKVWTGVMSIGTRGSRTFTAYAVNKFGATSDAMTADIAVKPYA